MKILSHTILPIAALLSSTSAFAQSGPWTISETRGDVIIQSGDGERAAIRGTRVAAGELVVTGNRGTATIVRGREFVTVRPNSRISIAPRERERGVIQIIQEFGSALFNIGRQPDPHFGVDTPYLAAVVKGTTFSITVSEEGASMQVTEGAVEASTFDRGARDLVRPGEIAIIAADDVYRLNIEGDVPRQLDSPQRGVSAPAAAVSKPTLAPASQASPSPVATTNATVSLSDNGVASNPPGRVQAAVITTAVGSSKVNVSELTGGLVSGEVGDGVNENFEARANTGNETSDNASEMVEDTISAGNSEANRRNEDAREDDVDDETGDAADNANADDDANDERDAGEAEGRDNGNSENGNVAENGDDFEDENDVAETEDRDDGNNGIGNGADGDDGDPGSGVGGGNDQGPGNAAENGDDFEDESDIAETDNRDDGNNGHGNGADGDDGDPGRGVGSGNGRGPGNAAENGDDFEDANDEAEFEDRDDGNNGNGNDADGDNDSDPGRGGGGGNDRGPGNVAENGDDFEDANDEAEFDDLDDGNGRGNGGDRDNEDDFDDDDFEDEDDNRGRNGRGRGNGNGNGGDEGDGDDGGDGDDADDCTISALGLCVGLSTSGIGGNDRFNPRGAGRMR